MSKSRIPFDTINAAALAQLPSLLREWFPNGQREGHEWRVGSINGEPGKSFSINIETGKFAEFNGLSESGRDVIGLYAAKFCPGDRVKAARDLADKFGIEIKRRAKPKPKPKAKPDEWISLVPPPPDAGPPAEAMLSGFDMVHCYTSLDGRETHYVGRIEERGDERKKFVPITYGTLTDKDGNTTTRWHKKAPNEPRPLYGLHKLVEKPNAPVQIHEGEKKTDAAQRMFPDYVCVSWFGGCGQVEKADLAPLAGHKLLSWPDADQSGRDAARKIIPRLPSDTQVLGVVRTDDLPDGFYAANLEQEGCDDPAVWLNERLIPAGEFCGDGSPSDDDVSETSRADDATDLVLPHGYKLDDDGLWYQPLRREDGTEPDLIKVCGPFGILARTSDDTHHNHGLLLRWTDADKERHTWAMPLRLVHGDGNAIAADLQDAGLRCGTSRQAHERLKQFFGAVIAYRRVRCVERAGWHDAVYLLPNGRAFGAAADDVVLQTERASVSGAYIERGDLAGWRENIAQHGVDNDLLALSISTAFAPPLLDVLGEPSGGLHLHGISQSGKTTLLRCAMSVYGPGDDKHMRTWRATANGLEAVAAETSDCFLPLDEIAQANAREVGGVVYTLANSTGKARANRAGGARRQEKLAYIFLFHR
jgi:hypothetical protein